MSSVHLKFKNRICILKGCLIPCERSHKGISEKPSRNSCTGFNKNCAKTVAHIKNSKVFADADIDYILENDDLPSFICYGCLRGVQRRPESFTPYLPLVEWHRNSKTRAQISNYETHLTASSTSDLQFRVDKCPFICMPLFLNHPNLYKGEPNEIQTKKAEIKERKSMIEKEFADISSSKTPKSTKNSRKNIGSSSDKRFGSVVPTEPNLCKICLQEIKRGGHSKADCTAKRGALKRMLEIARDRDIDEPLAVSVINDKIADNSINGGLRSGNNKRKNISTKHFRITEISVDDSINIMRTGKFSKAQYRIAHAFSKDANGLRKLPSLKSINSELDRRMEGLVSTHESYWPGKPNAKQLENIKALLEVGTFKLIDGVYHKRSPPEC